MRVRTSPGWTTGKNQGLIYYHSVVTSAERRGQNGIGARSHVEYAWSMLASV